MPEILFISGASGSGKTSLIEKLIPLLTARGLKTGALKHCPGHSDLDRPGADSERFAKAGALVSASQGDGRILVNSISSEQPTPHLLIGRFFPDIPLDIVLAEGYKDSPCDKIEVLRSAISTECLCKQGVIAYVTDVDREIGPRRLPLDNPRLVCEFVIDWLNTKRAFRSTPVRVISNGEEMQLNDFVANTLYSLVRAICANLRNIPGDDTLVIDIRSDGHTELHTSGGRVCNRSFVDSLVGKTITGFLSNLKGFDPQRDYSVRLLSPKVPSSSYFST